MTDGAVGSGGAVEGVGFGVGMRVVTALSFFSGHESDEDQWPFAGFLERRQLKHDGGQEHLRMPCFPWQLNPECSVVEWLVSPHFAQRL